MCALPRLVRTISCRIFEKAEELIAKIARTQTRFTITRFEISYSKAEPSTFLIISPMPFKIFFALLQIKVKEKSSITYR